MAGPRIAVSACLCGVAVRFDGTPCTDERFVRLWKDGKALAVCPECMGGLPIPRDPVELDGERRALSCGGKDCTTAFERGASQALSLCQRYGIRIAVLKEGSPSCGSNRIHDGSFSGRKIPGEGVTAALLRKNGIQVYSEENWDDRDL